MVNYLDAYLKQVKTISFEDFYNYELQYLDYLLNDKCYVNLDIICWFFNEYVKEHPLEFLVYNEEWDYVPCEDELQCDICSTSLKDYNVYKSKCCGRMYHCECFQTMEYESYNFCSNCGSEYKRDNIYDAYVTLMEEHVDEEELEGYISFPVGKLTVDSLSKKILVLFRWMFDTNIFAYIENNLDDFYDDYINSEYYQFYNEESSDDQYDDQYEVDVVSDKDDEDDEDYYEGNITCYKDYEANNIRYICDDNISSIASRYAKEQQDKYTFVVSNDDGKTLLEQLKKVYEFKPDALQLTPEIRFMPKESDQEKLYDEVEKNMGYRPTCMFINPTKTKIRIIESDNGSYNIYKDETYSVTLSGWISNSDETYTKTTKLRKYFLAEY